MGQLDDTDGGSRWISVKANVSSDNPLNPTHLAPPATATNPLPIAAQFSIINGIPYGSDIGGCRTYGDIRYTDNRWFQPPLPGQILLAAIEIALLGDAVKALTKGAIAHEGPFEPFGEVPTDRMTEPGSGARTIVHRRGCRARPADA